MTNDTIGIDMQKKCPQCAHSSLPKTENSAFPFCSERCKVIDLGQWFSDQYVISSPALDSDVYELPDPEGNGPQNK
jgi:endogenous inhibitor of DNA gyrase (YacG/DUF329 family)